MARHPLEQSFLATGANDGVVNIWDVRSPGKLLNSVHAHKGPVWDVVWHSMEPQYLFSSGEDGAALMWDFNASRSLTVRGCRPHVGAYCMLQAATLTAFLDASQVTYDAAASTDDGAGDNLRITTLHNAGMGVVALDVNARANMVRSWCVRRRRRVLAWCWIANSRAAAARASRVRSSCLRATTRLSCSMRRCQ